MAVLAHTTNTIMLQLVDAQQDALCAKSRTGNTLLHMLVLKNADNPTAIVILLKLDTRILAQKTHNSLCERAQKTTP